MAIYKQEYTLFDDDFTIVYDSEFTTEEVRNIYLGMNNKTICDKSMKLIEKSEYLKDNYNIDL